MARLRKRPLSKLQQLRHQRVVLMAESQRVAAQMFYAYGLRRGQLAGLHRKLQAAIEAVDAQIAALVAGRPAVEALTAAYGETVLATREAQRAARLAQGKMRTKIKGWATKGPKGLMTGMTQSQWQASTQRPSPVRMQRRAAQVPIFQSSNVLQSSAAMPASAEAAEATQAVEEAAAVAVAMARPLHLRAFPESSRDL